MCAMFSRFFRDRLSSLFKIEYLILIIALFTLGTTEFLKMQTYRKFATLDKTLLSLVHGESNGGG